jgi:hypothetical protein
VVLRDITVSKHNVNKTEWIRRRVFDAARFIHDLHELPKVTRFTDKQLTICVQTERAHYGHPLNWPVHVPFKSHWLLYVWPGSVVNKIISDVERNIMARSCKHFCLGKSIMHPLCIVGLHHLTVNNTKVLIFAMGFQRWVPFALFLSYKTFRTAVSSVNVALMFGIPVCVYLCWQIGLVLYTVRRKYLPNDKTSVGVEWSVWTKENIHCGINKTFH